MTAANYCVEIVAKCHFYDADTDPGNAADGAGVSVRFTTVFGKRYVVERTDGLPAPGWTAVSPVLDDNGAPQNFLRTRGDGRGSGNRFLLGADRAVGKPGGGKEI